MTENETKQALDTAKKLRETFVFNSPESKNHEDETVAEEVDEPNETEPYTEVTEDEADEASLASPDDPVIEEPPEDSADGPPDEAPEPAHKAAEFPGKIQLSGDLHGSYTNCEAIEFDNARAWNDWAKEHPTSLTVRAFTLNNKLVIVHTTKLTEEQLDDINEFGMEMDAYLQKKADQRAEAAHEAKRAERDAEKERARLADLGRKCEQNHSPAIAEKRAEKKQKGPLQKVASYALSKTKKRR